MPDKNHQAIVDALDVLARGASKKTNGKITAVNVAKEASVGKATLYRYFKKFPDLKNACEALRKNGIHLDEDAPETLQDACRLLEQEVKSLRSELAQTKAGAARMNELKSHQIQLLWMANERLEGEVGRLKVLRIKADDMTTLPMRKNTAKES